MILIFTCRAYSITALGGSMFGIMCFVVGLLTFSHNKLCDPIKDGVIQSKDQVCVTTQHTCVKCILAIYFAHFKLESMLRGFGVDQNREKLNLSSREFKKRE